MKIKTVKKFLKKIFSLKNLTRLLVLIAGLLLLLTSIGFYFLSF
ncbi:MAG: hypothetical protein KatS3mg090_0509 [Patescibacteria group bacterium]|nr:MAG: hypothetical protein KatS3mg090_0509 [Patescibacteria group bacterium]